MSEKKRFKTNQGVGITAICDDKFKTEYLSVTFMSEHDPALNSLYGVLPPVITRGSEKYPTLASVLKALEDTYDADLSYDYSISTKVVSISFSMTWISDRLVDETPSLEDRSLGILSDLILHPVRENGFISPSFVQLEKKSLIDYLRSEKDNKRQYALTELNKDYYGNDPVGKPRFGSIEEVEKITGKDITDLYEKMISSYCVEFFYYGSKSPDEIKEKIMGYFAPLFCDKERELDTLVLYSPYKPDTYTEREIDDTDSSQTTLAMAFSCPWEKDCPGAPLIYEILSYSPSSRFFMNVRERLAICYDCSLVFSNGKSSAFILSGVEYSRKDEARNAILHEIEDVANGNISDEEFLTAKKSLISSIRASAERRSSIEHRTISSLITQEEASLDERIAKIERATKEDVARCAKLMKLSSVVILAGRRSE